MRLCPYLLGTIVTVAPALARASDHIEVVVTERERQEIDTRVPGTTAPPGGERTRTVQVIERGDAVAKGTTWLALSLGVVTTPLTRRGALPQSDRLGTDAMHTCGGGGEKRLCTAVRGADVRLQIFSTEGTWHYPRVIGYLRSGYETAEARLAARSGGPHRGDATAVSFRAVPIFAGVSIYAFQRFPVRPFAGLGMGVDVMQLRYARHERASRRDISPRFGFELHGGIEARVGNYVSVAVELEQRWSVRRRLPGVPDLSNTRLAVITSLAVAVPYGSYARRDPRAHRVTTTTRVVEPTRASPPAERPRVGPPTTAPVFAAPLRTVIIAPPAGVPTAVSAPSPEG